MTVQRVPAFAPLRFSKTAGGPFLAEPGKFRIPPIVELNRLLSATERVIEGNEDEEDLRLLLAPGSSLGGARPKASVRDAKGGLAIAKFPHRDDTANVVLWEGVALGLAAFARFVRSEIAVYQRIVKQAGIPQQ